MPSALLTSTFANGSGRPHARSQMFMQRPDCALPSQAMGLAEKFNACFTEARTTA